MPPDYVIFACFALALYFYINQNIQFRSTASAICSVFTGECRMSCRQSRTSGFSGLSGLQGPGPSHTYTTVGPNCICESCPCPMIESFIRTCNPATRMYTTFISMLSQLYCSILASIQEAYEYVSRVVECRMSCQKPQVILCTRGDIVRTTNYDSDENIGFKDTEKDGNYSLKVSEKENQPLDKKKSSLAAFKEKILSKTSMSSKKSVSVFFKELVGKKKPADSDEAMQNMTDAMKASTSKSSGKGRCPKCVEKGETCLRECPNAKK